MRLQQVLNIFRSSEALGLSVGAGAVRAVKLSKTESGFTIAGSASEEIPTDIKPDSDWIYAAIGRVTKNLKNERTRLCVGVSALNSRILFFDLPFDRADKIRQVLAYTVEPKIMESVDDLVFDYWPLAENHKQGEPGIIFGSSRDTLEQILLTYQQSGIDPDILIPDCMGLIFAGQYFIGENGSPGYSLLLDLGAAHTSMVLFDSDRPVHFRTMPYGGLDITRALSKAIGVDLKQAEEIKRNLDLSDDADGEPKEVLIREWNKLAIEVERTLASIDLEISEPGPVLILSGGGALTPGLADFFTRTLEMETRIISHSEIPGRLNNLSPELTPAAGLAMLAMSTKHKANLRQGELSSRQNLTRYKWPLSIAAGGLLLAALLALFTLIIDSRYQEKAYADAKFEMTKIVKTTLPSVKRIVVPLAQMRQHVAKAQADAGSVNSDRTKVLELLFEINKVIKARRGIRVLDMIITANAIDIQAEGGSFEDVDRINDDLTGLPYFREVTIGGARVDPTTKKLTFKISMKRKS